MSYILDALKKQQAEQSGDAMSLDLKQPGRTTSTPAWMIVLVIALLANGALLVWFIVERENPQSRIAGEDPAAQTQADSQSTNPTSQPTQIIPEQTEIAQTGDRPSAQISLIELPEQQPPVSPRPSPPPTPAEVLYESLSEAERVIYDAFSYTSHIYTEAEDLRAIVIDGQRLQVGDSFKGLKIHDITETGLVFEENRRGKIRRVRVDPFR